ncbi:hypothetical protein [Streptomyces sp. NPDC020681]|uniref:hypothetical protein n=1 Tax=Streptomyces sp. NPDC020681 TaxID=3365083 RepID=UPI0037B3CB17
MMLTITMGMAAWVLAAVAASGALVRLLLGVLTAHAARKALRPSPAREAAQRLAVLRALLNGLKPPGR